MSSFSGEHYIVNKSIPHNFEHAARTLRNLFANAGVDVKTKVLVIPGNHDVKVFPEENEVFGRLAQFARFLKLFFDEKDYRSRTANFVTVDAAKHLCFICLDSTLKEHYQLAEGEVGDSQWDWVQRKFDQLTKAHPDFDQFIKIVALHHHPIPIESAGQERFMQLLDQGKALRAFEKNGVTLVLHGHKHFPHEKIQPFGSGRHCIVVGAGTATCPFVEEQAGEGNSLEVIRLRRSANLAEVQRWKANTDKAYKPTFPEPRRFPLFQPSETGYKMNEFQSITKIQDGEGTCLITSQRIGLVVDKQDFVLQNVGFSMGGLSHETEIVGFEYDREKVAEVKYEIQEKWSHKGHFLLRTPLRWGSDPIDFWFTFEIKKGMCMRRSDYQFFCPHKTDYLESTEIVVAHPCDRLTVAVEFPQKYIVKPWARAQDQNATPLDLGSVSHSLLSDPLANRHSLVVRKPKWHHEYGILWEVPED